MKLICLCLILINASQAFGLGEVIFALNAGGDAFTDSYGIRYRKDHLTDGTPSDYGKMIEIKRVWDGDKSLYETERYHLDTFGYSIPMPSGDGDYVLWLKFCEVWFNGENLKVFDVALNDAVVIEGLDIFKKVGRGVAHDEVIPFQVRKNTIIINGKGTNFNNEIRVDFLKGPRDNPKVNAIIVLKGSADQVPALPEYTKAESTDMLDEDEYDGGDLSDEDYNNEAEDLREKFKREAKEETKNEKSQREYNYEHDEIAADPYASDETYLIPILVAVGAFIPLLFCLCKL